MPEDLHFEPALDRPDLLPTSVNELLKNWRGATTVEEILVAPIDPEYADSAKFCERYGVDPRDGANCVIALAVRGETKTFAACLIPVDCRADLNNVARQTLGARRVSFAPLDEVLAETGMEYGGITPLGLPAEYPILIDRRLVELKRLIVGGGFRKSKLSVPGKLLAELPNAVIIENLGRKIEKK